MGFSPRGGHAGDGHPSCRTYNIWLVERLALAEQYAEDGFFHENSASFPYWRKFAKLHDSRRIITIKANPLNRGWGLSRDRCLTFGLSTRTAVWCGPQSIDDVQAEFDSLFGCLIPNCDSDTFFIDSESGVLSMLRERLARRGNFVKDDVDLKNFDWKAVLTPGQRSRLTAREATKCGREGLSGLFET